MADLTFVEREIIEELLEMESGYVLDFSNKSFARFIYETVNIDIWSEKYNKISISKANRLRRLFEIESNYIVSKLIREFCNYLLEKISLESPETTINNKIISKSLKIADRLVEDSIDVNINSISPNTDDRDFYILANEIKLGIRNNRPETVLDRLHTFTHRYIQEMCNKHEISFNKTESLNALYGKYIKFLKENNYIESDMSEKILKYSINIFDAFNDIRNNRSLAHPSNLLNYEESILIFNNISNAIKFIESIELKIPKKVDVFEPPF